MRTISHAPSVIMSFQCQRDSYAQNYTSHVISCQQANTAGELNGYEVVLQDTILFPEGGGQVCSFPTKVTVITIAIAIAV